MTEDPSNISPKDSALILAHQLSAFVIRASRYEGPNTTLNQAESGQIMSYYENLKGILNEQGFQERVDALLQAAREVVTQRFLHERSKDLERFGFPPVPAPDATVLDERVNSFPALWVDVVKVVAGAEMLFQQQGDRKIFGLADQFLRPE